MITPAHVIPEWAEVLMIIGGYIAGVITGHFMRCAHCPRITRASEKILESENLPADVKRKTIEALQGEDMEESKHKSTLL